MAERSARLPQYRRRIASIVQIANQYKELSVQLKGGLLEVARLDLTQMQVQSIR